MTIDRTVAKYLWDAHRSAERIARFTAAKTKSQYLENELLRSAVERQFEIIGEAFASLKRVDPDLATKVPDLAKIVAFRNVLIHGYATVDNALVWSAVTERIPDLLVVLERLLHEAGPP